MVEITKAEMIEEFDGKVVEVGVEPSQREDIEGEQVHIQIEPVNKDLLKDSKTGRMHEWVRLSPKSTETTVPEGSIAHRYIQAVEDVIKEAKETEKVLEVFQLLNEKTFTFKRKQLGKSFGGHEAKDYWVPAKLIE